MISSCHFIKKIYDLNIVDEKLCDIIGASDLFIASNSSTLTWATLCGIPAVNFAGPIENLFGYLDSTTYVSRLEEICDVIVECLRKTNICFENDWQVLSKNEVFDGKFGLRFLKLLES